MWCFSPWPSVDLYFVFLIWWICCPKHINHRFAPCVLLHFSPVFVLGHWRLFAAAETDGKHWRVLGLSTAGWNHLHLRTDSDPLEATPPSGLPKVTLWLSLSKSRCLLTENGHFSFSSNKITLCVHACACTLFISCFSKARMWSVPVLLLMRLSRAWKRCFEVVAPELWNHRPQPIRSALVCFKR